MPTWGGILEELTNSRGEGGAPNVDQIRRKYVAKYSEITGRNTIVYATAWLQKQVQNPQTIQISDEDVQGLMEVTHGLDGRQGLDLILHSPGGSPEAAEAFVSYLRSKFSNVRVIVPHMAMSAATMIACSADMVIMGKHSSLGPVDPQFILATPLGVMAVPAQAIIEQFDRAKSECADPSNVNAWYPILSQYGPALLQQCEYAQRLGKTLVGTWLELYMFRRSKRRALLAGGLADFLNSHGEHMSHGRHLGRSVLRSKGMKILSLERDQDLQDAALSVFHCVTHTFTNTLAVKLIENQLGKAFIKIEQPMMVPVGNG